MKTQLKEIDSFSIHLMDLDKRRHGGVLTRSIWTLN